mgnify:CR=1 FL=1
MALEQTDEQPTDLESHLLHAVSNVITTVLFGDWLDYHDPILDDLQFSKYAGLTFLAHMVPAVKVVYSLYVRICTSDSRIYSSTLIDHQYKLYLYHAAHP